jgi:hypothetical protein
MEMKNKKLSIGMSLVLFVGAAGIIHSAEAPKRPAIDPKADAVLHQLSDQNKQVKAAIVRVTDTIDDVGLDNRKVQFAHVREMTLVRPNKLKIETTGDVTTRTMWKDGKTVTVLERDQNVYAQIPDPGTITQALDLLQEKYNMSVPASDLLSTDVYRTMTEGCEAINYVGLGYVGEEKCHHLAFTRDNIDWQLWVTAGDKPLPRKMVITYKHLPGEPQYTMQLLKIEYNPSINDSVFACQIPKGAEKIEFQLADNSK